MKDQVSGMASYITDSRVRLFFLGALLCCFAAGCTSPRQRGIRVREARWQSPYTTAYGRSTVIAVGIDRYQHADRLRHAVHDALGVCEMFSRQGFHVIKLLEEEATKQAVEDALKTTFFSSQPNDRIVFFFAGHGIDIEVDGTTKGFLIPVGGKTTHPKSLIPLDWLQTELIKDSRTRAKHSLFILDACSSGILASRSTVHVDASTRNYIQELLKRSARQVITAGTAEQEVLDGGYGGHSIFTGLVRQGIEKNLADMNNDFHVTATELGVFLSQQVWVRSGGAQKPDYAKLLGTRGGEVIVRFPTTDERKALAARRLDATSPPELELTVTPDAFTVAVFTMDDHCVFREDVVDGRAVIKGLNPGDYQVEVYPRAKSDYEAVRVIVGFYKRVKRDITLPRKRPAIVTPHFL